MYKNETQNDRRLLAEINYIIFVDNYFCKFMVKLVLNEMNEDGKVLKKFEI